MKLKQNWNSKSSITFEVIGWICMEVIAIPPSHTKSHFLQMLFIADMLLIIRFPIVHLEASLFIAVPDTTQTQRRMIVFNIQSVSSSYLPIILNTISKKYTSSISLLEYHLYPQILWQQFISIINNQSIIFLAFTFQCISEIPIFTKTEKILMENIMGNF